MEKKKRYDIKYRYYIVLFCNKKKCKLIHKSAKRSTILKIWNELKTQKQPPYIKLNSGKKRTKMNFQLALIYPKTRWSDKTYIKDDMGRNVEVTIDNDKQRIKYIIPYWEEEKIYDYDLKKRIKYHEVLNYILGISDFGQIFTLNNKLLVQVDLDIKMYINKNISDTVRLFDIIRDDLIKRNKTNFMFVKDINTHQRLQLYDLLESKGFKRSELIKHYSY